MSFGKRLLGYVKHHFVEKWKFVYLAIDLTVPMIELPLTGDLNIRLATEKDLPKFETDVFPYLTDGENYDKRFIKRVGESNVEVFVAEKDDKIVHYFILYANALTSPLVKTPVRIEFLSKSDAYIGGTFTLPHARGSWIAAHVLQNILIALKSRRGIERAILLVHSETPGAVRFFEKMGFSKIENAAHTYARIMAKIIERVRL